MNKNDKNGLQLFVVTDEMLLNIDVMANIHKKAGDKQGYDFLMSIKTGMSKYAVTANHLKEIATLNRACAKALTEAADYEEQLFPAPVEKKES